MKNAAIVTGASGGIGRAIAKKLAYEGWSVLVHYFSNEKAAYCLESELTAEGYRALAYQADIADSNAVKRMVVEAESKLGRVELIVNSAGISHTGLFQDVDDVLWKRIMDVNLFGTRNLIMAVLPGMLERKRGCIINISSIWGSNAASCEVVYSCSKAAIEGLTRSLAAELAPSGIRINCIAPGCISTDMTLKLGEDTVSLLINETPLGRLGTPEDIADAVAFLTSNSAKFITGQVLTVDGGFTL